MTWPPATPGTPIQVGNGPDAIAITPDGKTAYVGNYGDKNGSGDTMTPIDVATGRAGHSDQGRERPVGDRDHA